MATNFPNLLVIPARDAVLHEETDPARVGRLKRKIVRERILSEPPLVARMGGGKYVVLDGANRVTVLRQLGVPHLAVQVVNYRLPDVQLETWNHLVCDRRFRRHFAQSVKRFTLADADQMLPFVNAYRGRYRFYRVTGDEAVQLRQPGATCLVIFPKLRPADIIRFARANEPIPSGITRHLIAGRMLNANLPLAALRGRASLASKRRWLHQWLSSKLRERKIRYYAEPTFMVYE